MDVESIQLMHGNLSLRREFSHIKKGEDETIPMFYAKFVKVLHKIHRSFQQGVF